MKIIISESQYKSLKKGSLSTKLMNQIEENGWIETSELVGGVENLLNIIGEEKVVDLFISLFTDLRLTKKDGDITLYDWNLPMIEKYFDDSTSKTTLVVDHSSIALRILSKLGDEGISLYKKYKDDFINKLISMFPELSDKSNLNESKLANSLINQIKENGWLETAELVGGSKNLISIIGEDSIMDMLMSCFKDLHVENRGGDTYLMDGGLPILQKKSSFWGLSLISYHGYITSRLNQYLGFDIVIDVFQKNIRRDLIRELVKRFPELYVEDVDVYLDSGLYNKIDSFSL